MIDIKSIYSNIRKTPNFLIESKASHLRHLFEDGTLTFDDIRNIFKQVFTGKVRVSDKVDRISLGVTCKDGGFAFSNDEASTKEPFSVDKICNRCKCQGKAKEAVTLTMNEFMKALNHLDQAELNSIFANGLNYYKFDLIVPPEQNLADYDNRCFMQRNKVNCYDCNFNNISEDEDNTVKLNDRLGQYMQKHNCEISPENIERLKSSSSLDKSLALVSDKLAQLVDGIGYRATINDYVKEKFAKHIVNCALKHGIDVYHNSDFVNELIARLSHVSNHRPNRGDMITYAKRDGIDFKAPEYKEFMSDLESTAAETNNAIIKPIEDLVILAGVQLMKCFLGLVAADPRKSVKKLLPELDSAIANIENDNEGLTPEKIKSFRHCMKNLDNYQQNLPEDGIIIFHNGKACKIKGNFGKINNIMKLMNY